MPGTPLTLDYPVIGEPIATALGKLIAILQALQADIEPKILPSEFSWTSDLSAQGHALSSLSKIQLDEIASAAGLPTGTLYIDDGDLWVQTSSGSVRITLAGQINASGLGGISGDFGGSNPARVTYTDLTDTYAFTADTNDWSAIECQEVKLRNNGNWTTLRADPAQSTAQSHLFGAPNGSGIALLRQTSGGIIQSTGTIDQPLTMSESITFTGSGKIKHGTRIKRILPRERTGAAWTINASGMFATSGAVTGRFEIPEQMTWERYISVTVYFAKTTAGSADIRLWSVDTTVSSVPTAASLQPSTTVNGRVQLSVSFTTPQTFNPNLTYYVEINVPAINDTVHQITGSFDSV